MVLLKAGRSKVTRDSGGFVIRLNMPGWMFPRPTDHGHGALALVVESFLAPGRLVALHQHRNDEIISWVPDGVMRHHDDVSGDLVTDPGHLLVMNAGRSFWHSERTLPTDPPLRMLQIMVRPHSIDLEPNIQHGPLPAWMPNVWRHLFGPEGSSAPFFVRNTIDFFDIRLTVGARVTLPDIPGRDVYFYVFTGDIEAGGQSFGEAEQGLLLAGETLEIEAKTAAVVVAFLIDPTAQLVRQGTIGDSPKIPPPSRARLLLWLLGVLQWFRRRT